MHINIIIEHFKQNEILITKSQVQYLCAYFIGARDAKARDLFGMPSLSDDVSEQDILQLFKESNWEGVHKKICDLHLAEMMVEGFTLINSSVSSTSKVRTHQDNMPTFLSDNRKYLL